MGNPVVTDLAVAIGDWSARMGSAPVVDSDGVGWYLGELDGWFGGQTVRASPLDRLQGDGVIDGPVSFGARTLTLAGSLVAPDRAALQRAMNRVGQLLTGPTRYGTLRVDEVDLSRQSRVRLASGSKAKVSNRCRADWELDLFAPDPLRYATTESVATTARYSAGGLFTIPLVVPIVFGAAGSSGFVTVTNHGNADVWPTFEFAGPLVNPVVRVVGGAQISPLMTVNAGEVLRVNTAERSVRLGSSSRRAALSFDSSWFPLSPGDTTLYFGADDGTGTVTARWRDAWS